VLVLPFAGHYAEFGKRPLIAWNDSRSAARALNDSLSIIAPGCEATVISFTQPHAQPSETVPRIVKHLACHGVTAKEDTLVVQDIGVMDMLLNRAADHGSDLLVAGAFGNYGFPVLNRGGGTRFLLHHMTLPVLFSH
jgi:nucleotide-binding universal stress UspA family protein